jgi:hypothetical protein
VYNENENIHKYTHKYLHIRIYYSFKYLHNIYLHVNFLFLLGNSKSEHLIETIILYKKLNITILYSNKIRLWLHLIRRDSLTIENVSL